jgi:hypothetical protein
VDPFEGIAVTILALLPGALFTWCLFADGTIPAAMRLVDSKVSTAAS